MFDNAPVGGEAEGIVGGRVAPGLIAFEGLDGTGKTRLGNIVAERLNAMTIHTPPNLYDTVRDVLQGRPGVESFLMYLSSCAYAYGEYLRSESGLLLLDRFWFSSVVHYGWTSGTDAERADELIRWVMKLLPVPHTTVFLRTEREERLRRLAGRDTPSHGIQSEAYERYWYECALRARDALPPASVLWMDTTDRTNEVEEAAAELAGEILGRLNASLATRDIRLLVVCGGDPHESAELARSLLGESIRRMRKIGIVRFEAGALADERVLSYQRERLAEQVAPGVEGVLLMYPENPGRERLVSLLDGLPFTSIKLLEFGEAAPSALVCDRKHDEDFRFLPRKNNGHTTPPSDWPPHDASPKKDSATSQSFTDYAKRLMFDESLRVV